MTETDRDRERAELLLLLSPPSGMGSSSESGHMGLGGEDLGGLGMGPSKAETPSPSWALRVSSPSRARPKGEGVKEPPTQGWISYGSMRVPGRSQLQGKPRDSGLSATHALSDPGLPTRSPARLADLGPLELEPVPGPAVSDPGPLPSLFRTEPWLSVTLLAVPTAILGVFNILMLCLLVP